MSVAILPDDDLEPAEAADAGLALASGEAPHLPKVYGEPLLEMPRDLYIPPDALEIILDSFEGPLDLLLYLIRRANISVLDIPMAPLTAQYLIYVEAMRKGNLELTAEYLLMAAMLIEIKSRMLLPRPEKLEQGEALDPRAELVRRLLEYEQMKLAAQNINSVPQLGRDFEMVTVFLDRLAVKRLPQVSTDDLMAAWGDILRRVKMNTHHRIGRQDLSVREHMSRILKQLQEKGQSLFTELFPEQAGRPELVVTFLALLELTRERLVDLMQTESFAPIYARACIIETAAS